MRSLWTKWTALVPAPFLIALMLAAGFMAFVAWDQSHWWSTKEDYSFGWLVPAFVGFVVYDRWARIREKLHAAGAPGSPRAHGAAGWVLGTLVYGALIAGVLLFLLGALYRAGAGPSYPGSLALSLGCASILLPLLFLNAPEPGTGEASPAVGNLPAGHAGAASPGFMRKLFGDARVTLVGLFIFPCLVWLVSAPMVSVVENNLSLFLLNRVTTVVFFVFETLGMPIEQQGNVLVLPPVVEGMENKVGVAEACSGIRSLTACLFAGSFLSAVFLDKLWKKVALVVASMLFAFGMNLLRSLFLTGWAYRYGHEAIEGQVHDIAGYAVLGLTVVGLLCLMPLFNLKFADDDDLPASNPSAP